MKRGTFPAALYGRPVETVTMTARIPVLRAVLTDATHIRCGTLFVIDANPVAALCRALRDNGTPDCALQVRWADRSPAVFVASVHASAWSVRELAT